MKALDDWFKDWFGSPYYPILYQNRDHQEAFLFISELIEHLGLPPGSRILDLACGRGRHTAHLAASGMEAFGVDLSAESIAEAREQQIGHTQFFVHDMREPFPPQLRDLDAVLNLFTSFGYFAEIEENLKVLNNIHQSLRPGGNLVLDYLNVHLVKATLIPEEEKTIDNLHFHIRRSVVDGRINKQITIKDRNTTQQYTEQVQAFSLEDFQRMFKQSAFELDHIWGDYHGASFDPGSSPRLVMFARKVG